MFLFALLRDVVFEHCALTTMQAVSSGPRRFIERVPLSSRDNTYRDLSEPVIRQISFVFI
jgi:hypothetical protein